MRKRNLITILTIIAVVLLSIFLIVGNGHVSEKTAKCIGENSELYVQLGCHACESQEKMFGENKKYLNIIDCFYEGEKCDDIMYTPTWIIDDEKYIGVQSIEKLKEVTGC